MAKAKVADKKVPPFIADLLSAIEQKVPGATTDVERIGGLDHYFWRVAVLSEHFRDMEFDDRHALVWKIAKETMEPHRYRRISMILCLTEEELRGEE